LPLVISVRESGRTSGWAQNSCPFCGARLAEGQESFICADGTKDVSCAPCHLVRHLDRRTIDEEAVLIWLPEMTQPALNKLANVAHRRLADAGALYRAADPLAGLHQDIARGAIEALRAIEKRRIEAEARLGTSSPRLLAAALLRAKPKFYQDRAPARRITTFVPRSILCRRRRHLSPTHRRTGRARDARSGSGDSAKRIPAER
jgi:intracellular multiplication protein IcmJ